MKMMKCASADSRRVVLLPFGPRPRLGLERSDTSDAFLEIVEVSCQQAVRYWHIMELVAFNAIDDVLL